MEKEYSIPELVFKYCPDIFNIINKKVNWTRVTRIQNEIIKNREKRRIRENLSSIDVETSFVDLLERASDGEKGMESFLRYLNFVAKYIRDNLQNNMYNKFRELILGKLFNPDSLNYLSVYSEILTLERFLKCKDINLLDIESKIDGYINLKPKDFKITNLQKNQINFVEVVSIHYDEKKISKLNDLKEIIFYKLIDKISFETSGDLLNENKVPLIFCPTLWCFDVKTVLPFKDFFSQFEKNNGKELGLGFPILGFNTFSQTPYTNGYYSYKFGPVTSILKDFES